MNMNCVEKKITHKADIYFLIARLFSEPEPGFNDLINQLEPIIASDYPSLLANCHDIQIIISEYHEDSFTSLLSAYSALFIGPFQTIAPPFASVYLNEGILMGSSTMTVIDCYRSIGLEVQPGRSIENLPDNISVELEFLYHCLISYYESGDKSFYQLAHAFISVHMMNWVPEFTQRIIESNIHPFYNNLAVFLMMFLEEDLSRFSQ